MAGFALFFWAVAFVWRDAFELDADFVWDDAFVVGPEPASIRL